MSGHTPGRLIVKGGWSIYAEETRTPVADACIANSTPASDEANARRLVACWNACEGLSTEHLENIDMLGDTLESRFKLRNQEERELTAQRDELLSALKLLMEMLDDEIQSTSDEQLAFGLSDPNCPEHVKSELKIVIACRAAIAKAES